MFSKLMLVMNKLQPLFYKGKRMGELHPVMYASRKLLPREVRYAIPNKEGLAVFWA